MIDGDDMICYDMVPIEQMFNASERSMKDLFCSSSVIESVKVTGSQYGVDPLLRNLLFENDFSRFLLGRHD